MLEELTGVLDRLCAAEPAALGDGETLVRLHRQLERLNAVVTRADAAFDAGRSWEADAARSSAAWIAARCRTVGVAARRRVRVGRALRSMPATEAAWLDGDIGEAHVEPLTAVRRGVGPDRFDPDEAQLVGYAKALPFREFGRLLTYWAQAVNPDGAERDAQAQRGCASTAPCAELRRHVVRRGLLRSGGGRDRGPSAEVD